MIEFKRGSQYIKAMLDKTQASSFVAPKRRSVDASRLVEILKNRRWAMRFDKSMRAKGVDPMSGRIIKDYKLQAIRQLTEFARGDQILRGMIKHPWLGAGKYYSSRAGTLSERQIAAVKGKPQMLNIRDQKIWAINDILNKRGYYKVVGKKPETFPSHVRKIRYRIVEEARLRRKYSKAFPKSFAKMEERYLKRNPPPR
jgi:hypothetical protein